MQRMLRRLLLLATAHFIKGIPPPPPSNKPLTYQNYAIALNNSLMPLCGNGRLDTIADYQSYFNTSARAKLMFPSSRLTEGGTGEVEVQFAMAEVCDDGNRLDGDGCSADCLNFDSLVSACDIALPPEIGLIEDFAFVGDKAVLATKDALYTVSGGLHTATMMAPKSAVVTSMLWYQNELWVFAESAIYVIRGGLMQKNFTVTTSDDGYLLEEAGKLYLVCKDAGHIWLWDVTARELLSSLVGTMPPAIAYMKILGSLQILMENSVGATVSLAAGTVEFMPRDNPTSDYWTDAANACFSRFMLMEASLVDVSVNYIPSIFSGLAQTIGYHSRILSPTIFAENMMGPRWLLNASEPQAIAMLFFGAYDLNNTPIDYDILKGGSFVRGPSYMDTITTAVDYTRPDLWPAQFEALTATLKQKIRRITRLAENPTTKSLWVLKAGVLKDISRRGVVVERNGRCVPTCAGLCPACHWSPDCGSCVPCPRFSEALEWQLQCQPCAAATGLARRRLLLAGSNNVIAFSVMGSDVDIESVFPHSTTMHHSDDVYDIEVDATSDPQATMRSVNSKLQNFQIVTRPRLVLHDQNSSASPRHTITAALVISLVVSLAYVL